MARKLKPTPITVDKSMAEIWEAHAMDTANWNAKEDCVESWCKCGEHHLWNGYWKESRKSPHDNHRWEKLVYHVHSLIALT